MDRKKIFIFGIVLLIGLMFTGCAWFHSGDYASPYHNLGSGFGYYGYPYYQGYEGEENPTFDEHHHHNH